MTPLEIKEQYVSRTAKQGGHPGLYKIIKSAHARYGIENGYELDAMIGAFFMHQFLPNLEDLETEMEKVMEDLAAEAGYTGDVDKVSAIKRLMDNKFAKLTDSARVLVASLFGELDGDDDVAEYIAFRGEEFRCMQAATQVYLSRQIGEDKP